MDSINYYDPNQVNALIYQKRIDYETSSEGVRSQAEFDKQVALDEQKYQHKVNLQYLREAAKQRIFEFYEKDYCTWYRVVTGNGRIIQEVPVADCVIKDVKALALDDYNGEKFFSLTLANRTDTVKIGPFSLNKINTPSKLKATPLIAHIYAPANLVNKTLEHFYYDILARISNSKDVEVIPSIPGWNISFNKIKFCPSDDDTFEYSEELRNHRPRYIVRTVEDHINTAAFLNPEMTDELACLLGIRLVALLGRLYTDLNIQLGVILVGDNSLDVARRLLSTVTPAKVINLSSDRINHIRDTALRTRDTSLIFMVDNLEDKTCRNRFNQVLGWYHSGYIEGIKLTNPIVFCVNNISPTIKLEDFIVIKTDKVEAYCHEVEFDAIQSLWLDYIEGTEKKTLYDHIGPKIEQPTPVEVLKKLIHKVLYDSQAFDHRVCELGVLSTALDKVQAYWKRILQSRRINLIDEFINTVIDMVSKSELQFMDYSKAKEGREKVKFNSMILYDEDYYYFTNEVMISVAETAKFDSRCVLSIKQQLINQGLAKIYRNSGTHNKELQIDLTIKNPETFEREYISVFAIDRKLWDDVGELKLFEMEGTV